MSTEMTDTLRSMFKAFPGERKYRLSIEVGRDKPMEWCATIEDDLEERVYGWGATAEAALASLQSRAVNRRPLAERKAQAVAAMEKRISELQGEVTKAGVV